MTYIAALRAMNPLVICLTNDVVKNFTANGLLAIGASPAMSSCMEDLSDLLPHAQALLVNIGTINPALALTYKKAVALANELNIPVILDPVACGASVFRRHIVLDLLLHHKITLLRGNAGEIASLVQAKYLLARENIGNTVTNSSLNSETSMVTAKGVDSSAVAIPGMLAFQCAKAFDVLTIVTGPTDGISDGITTAEVVNGSPIMPLVVGTGCLLGSVLAAFIGVSVKKKENLFLNTLWGLTAFAVAGEMAAHMCKSLYGRVEPGSFQIEFINALYRLTDEEVNNYKHWKRPFNRKALEIYFICGTQDFKSATNPVKACLTCIETALQSGITMFQLREKGQGALEGPAKVEFANKVKTLCKAYKVPFIMNDDMALAEALDVDGVHIGQTDENIEVVRKRFPNKIIGLSIHSPEEYAHSRVDLADYIGVGPIYGTQSKGDAKEPIGLEGITQVRKVANDIPIVAIGGIKVQTAGAIRACGADGVAVISAITQANDVVEIVQQLKKTVE